MAAIMDTSAIGGCNPAAAICTHGVTREPLQAQVREYDGYHCVHWSGHGHLNLLELARPGPAAPATGSPGDSSWTSSSPPGACSRGSLS